jgi:hypothetical protein
LARRRNPPPDRQEKTAERGTHGSPRKKKEGGEKGTEHDSGQIVADLNTKGWHRQEGFSVFRAFLCCQASPTH